MQHKGGLNRRRALKLIPSILYKYHLFAHFKGKLGISECDQQQRHNGMRAAIFLLKTILPIALLAGGFLIFKYLMATKPEPQKRPPVDRTPVVEVQTIQSTDYTVKIKASGTVKARMQGSLIAQVGGRVVELAPQFVSGGYFKKGDTLAILDDSDYQNSITIAQTSVVSSELSLTQLEQEEHNAQQNLRTAQLNLENAQANLSNNQQILQFAQQDLQTSQANLKPIQSNLKLAQQELQRLQQLWQQRLIARNQLDAQQQQVNQQRQQLNQQQQQVTQKQQQIVQQQQQIKNAQNQITQQQQQVANVENQLATLQTRKSSAKTAIKSGQAKLRQEERSQNRTRIIAPYDGRFLSTNVAQGQYVSPNSVLGRIYATDYLEVDIPLSLAQYEMLDLNQAKSPVLLQSPLGQIKQSWQAYITGTRAELDPQSRQITVVARINNPYANQNTLNSLKLGQYLRAELTGKTYPNVYALPTQAVQQEKQIILFQKQKVSIKTVERIWTENERVIVQSEQPLAGQKLIITPLPQATEGMKVLLPGQKKRKRRPEGKPQDKPNRDMQKPQAEEEKQRRKANQEKAQGE